MIAESYKRKVSWRQVGYEPPVKIRFVRAYNQTQFAAGSLDKPQEETNYHRSVCSRSATSRKRKILFEWSERSVVEDLDIRHLDSVTQCSETTPRKKLRQPNSCALQVSPVSQQDYGHTACSGTKSLQGTMTLTGMRTGDEDPLFNNFNFWKPVLPDIETELDIGISQEGMMDMTDTQHGVQHEDPAFNSFNFWKPVLPDIDLELCQE